MSKQASQHIRTAAGIMVWLALLALSNESLAQVIDTTRSGCSC